MKEPNKKVKKNLLFGLFSVFAIKMSLLRDRELDEMGKMCGLNLFFTAVTTVFYTEFFFV